MARLRIALAIAAAMATRPCLAQADSAAASRLPVPGRSVVTTTLGIVASSSPLASEAGAQLLERGGSAVDAAIAANATLGVVEPHMNGIGGDLFAIVYEAKTGKLYGLNASGWAPTGLTPEFLAGKGITKMPRAGIYSITVPGAVSGWDALQRRFGRLPLATDARAGDLLCRAGISAGRSECRRLGEMPRAAIAEAAGKATYLPNGHAPKPGEIFKNPDLGALAPSHRCPRARRVLPGSDRRGDPDAVARARRHDDGRRPGRSRARVGDADPEHVSRLDRVRDAPQRAGHRGAHDAQHHGAVPAGRVRLSQHPRAARDDRGEEVGVRRHAALRRRPAIRQGAGGGDARQAARHRASRPDRPGAGALHRDALAVRPGGDRQGQRDDLSHRDRRRGQHGLAHPEQLLRFRLEAGGTQRGAS